jgi:hypothetical protein
VLGSKYSRKTASKQPPPADADADADIDAEDFTMDFAYSGGEGFEQKEEVHAVRDTCTHTYVHVYVPYLDV